MEHSHKEAAALSVMRENAHATLNVHGLDILLREHAWHQLVMGFLQNRLGKLERPSEGTLYANDVAVRSAGN